MAWETEMVRHVRHMINDLDSANYTYSNGRLEELILIAAQQVYQELDFAQTYTVDLDELDITPDPTDRDNRDENFIKLTCLKAACIVDRAETRTAAAQNVEVRSNRTSVSLKGVLQGRLALLDKGWCKEYAEAKQQYQYNKTNIVGAAILSPFPWDVGGLREN